MPHPEPTAPAPDTSTGTSPEGGLPASVITAVTALAVHATDALAAGVHLRGDPLAPGGPAEVVAAVLDTGEPARRTGDGAACAVPLHGARAALGVLWVTGDPDRSWTELDVDQLRQLAVLTSAQLEGDVRQGRTEGARRSAVLGRTQARLLLQLSEALTDTETVADVARALDRVAATHLGTRWTYLGLLDDQRRRLHFLPLADRPGAGQEHWAGMPAEADHPPARVARTTVPLFYADAAARRADFGTPWAQVGEQMPFQASAHLPLVVGGQVVGSLSLVHDTATEWSLHDKSAMLALAGYTAQALQRAQLLAERRTAAQTLQLAMLTELPEPDHLEVRARYLPSSDLDQVGGDWYDAFLTPDGATTLAVGDVTGHDSRAAAAMGQMRSLLRAYGVDRDEPPSALVTRLDRAVQALAVDTLATVVCAQVEQDPQQRAGGWRRLRWTNAGHPPPVLVDPTGEARLLDTPTNLLVGLDPGTRRDDHVVDVAPGSTLLLYTDGLVERRGIDLDASTAALARLAGEHHHRDLDALLDALLDGAHAAADDDIVILAVRLHPED